MPSTALYTDVGKVVAALAFQSPETLNVAANAGAVSITVTPTIPSDWQVGSTLVIDSNNPALRESVTITGAPNGNTIPVSALANSHVQGAPVVNGTIAANYVAPASRTFDSVTYCTAGFAYELVTEVRNGYFGREGYLVIPLSKPLVKLADVISTKFQGTPLDAADTLDLTKAWIRDDYFLEVVPSQTYPRKGLATVTYSGGYNPLPDDLINAVTIIAARLYKIRDSGYSDVIGNSDTGILQYKKAIPADVAAIVQKYRRWTE